MVPILAAPVKEILPLTYTEELVIFALPTSLRPWTGVHRIAFRCSSYNSYANRLRAYESIVVVVMIDIARAGDNFLS